MDKRRFVWRSGMRAFGVAWFVAFVLLFSRDAPALLAADPVDVGWRDLSFGTICKPSLTGEKPESKLWFHDGFWWGSLCNGAEGKYYIYRLDLATQNWIQTNAALDDRPGSKADVLWDLATQKLYVVSHPFTNSGSPTSSSSSWGRLYRYSYDSGNKSYILDAGFPVHVTRGKSETLTLDKDSTGRLWVTYVESNKVMVNHSLGNDADWRLPYILPVTGATGLSSDDISSLISFSGRIGVMWSNQQTKIMYFATHQDGDPDDQNWQSTNAYNPGGAGADDHINLKSVQTDDAGRVFAVTKTSFGSSNQPLILLLACQALPCTTAGDWQAHTVYRTQENDTRPILLIDQGLRKLHVFTTDKGTGGDIRYKVSDMDNIQFPVGEGQVFIKETGIEINNATSTKQNVNSATGILVVASSGMNTSYYHNYLTLGGGTGNQAPVVNAGADQAVTLPASASLDGAVSDDGQPAPPALTTTWSQQSGPGTVSFGDASAVDTTASFPAAGVYVLRLAASDGALSAFDEVTVTVNPASPGNQAPVVNAGADQAITLPASASLDGAVNDDGQPAPPTLTTTWSQQSGPGTVSFANASAVDTTASFPAAGVYVLRLTASDGALSAFDEVTVTVQNGGSANTVEVRVSAGTDDAEEAASGSVLRGNPALELVFNGSNQTVGLRFHSLNLPPGATITNAYVQFFATKNATAAASLTIQGQSIDNAPTFGSGNFNISSRAKTTLATAWSPAPWTANAAGLEQRTPNLAAVIQEIVNRPGWASNNGLVLLITGTGQRIAASFNRNPVEAPLLHVEYTTAAGAGPVISGFTPANGSVGRK